jgi:hypothetical protein
VFTQKLTAFRDTLPEDEQCLLNAIYYAAMGQHEAKDEVTQTYWVTSGPCGVAVGGPYGWAARPWSVAYSAQFPAYS